MNRNAFIYAAVIVGSLGIALDFATVDLALPAMEEQFSLDFQSIQWVINGYILAFSVLMVAGGKMADAYGRKPVFLLGMGIFALASLLGGFAWDGASIIAFRVLQGVGAAMMWPAMIGMACAAVGDENRGFALGLIFGTCSVGNAAGPVVGGALTQWYSWRWVLWVNVPLALIAMIIAWLKVPKEKIEEAEIRNDYPGMLALTGGLVALMIVVYQAQSWGWNDARTIGLAMLALVLLAAFPFIERKTEAPLVPLDLMRSREFLTLCLCAIVICQLFFVVLLYFTQYAMKFLGEDPIWAGARVVQFMLMYGLVSYFGGPLSAWIGTRRLLVIGLASSTVAAVVLAIFGPGAPWIIFNGALILLGVGVGAVIPTLNSRAIETVGTSRASLVSGITFMCQLSGSAVMLAVNTALFAGVGALRLHAMFAGEGITLNPAEAGVISSVMSGAQTMHSIPAHTIADVKNFAPIVDQAYRDGISAVLWLSALLVLATLVCVLRYVKQRPRATA
jgi:EmrB/QacA subfamily drug resistance transporter